MKQLLAGMIAAAFLAALCSAAVEPAESYRIKPGDHLSVYVHENEDLSISSTVLSDGTISYPLVGNLYVQGLTTTSLQAILMDKLKQYLQNPVVVVTIASETMRKIYVMGEVGRPDEYPYQENLRLTDYLAIAGGVTQYANLKKCNVYSVGADSVRRVIDLNEIFERNNAALNLYLRPNDTIVLERRSGFIITNWQEAANIFGIIISAATLYYIASRQ